MRKHEWFDVEMAVSYRMKYTVYAVDEDEALDIAQAEAEDEIPENAYRVGVDCEDVTLNIDGDDYDDSE